MRQSNSTVRCIDIPIEELHSLTEAVNNSNLPKEIASNIAGKAKESEKAVSEQAQADKPKRKGHGRNGASAYPGATIVHVKHESLSAGMACPHCSEGKLYDQKEPAPIMRFVGRPPIGGSQYELEKFRCNLCGGGVQGGR